MEWTNHKANNYMDTLGKRLEYFRRSKGFNTQESFAKATGIKRAAYANYEKDKTKPNSDILEHISKKMGINLTWLITGEGDISAKEMIKTELNEKNGDYQSGITGKNEIISKNNINGFNNNTIHVVYGQSPKEDKDHDYSLDAMRLITRIMVSNDDKMIKLAVSQLAAIVQMLEEKAREDGR